MPRLQTFAKDLQLATAAIAPENIAAELAKFARVELASTISDGTGSPFYDKFVNGREGAEEETVVAPGPIVYAFVWWGDIIPYALQFLVERSPAQSGLYKQSWIVRSNGRLISDARQIRFGDKVEITNTQPYHRKVDVGHMRMSVPHQLIEDARQAVNRIWGNMVEARRTLIQLPGGYVLKGRFHRGFRLHARRKLRADVSAGEAMTYPALSLSMRI